MAPRSKQPRLSFLLTVGLAAWIVPGAGYFLLKERLRAVIVFVTITLTFATGLYLGSIGVVDPVTSRMPYAGQIMSSPLVAFLGHITAGGQYPVFGWPREIGQIYTGTAGLLNLLCIINSVYMAHIRTAQPEEH